MVRHGNPNYYDPVDAVPRRLWCHALSRQESAGKMTRDEILNMPAGEEIDKLIAEKVMGWHIQEEKGGRNQWLDSDGHYQHMVSRYDGYEDAEDFETICWHPSESILWAWEVVEFLRRRFWSTNIVCWDFSDKWVITCEHRTGHGEPKKTLYADAETAPLAICRAALLAVMDVQP
jgi:hypothetical protein